MVLCRSTNEGHAANVDVFDGIGIGDIWSGNGLFKWIEVDGDQINIIPAEIEKLLDDLRSVGRARSPPWMAGCKS